MASLTSFIPLTSPQFGADDLQLAFLSSGRPLAEKMVALESDLMAQLSLTEEPIVQPKPRRDCERCE